MASPSPLRRVARPPRVETFSQLRDLVERKAGIHRTSMGKLRDIQGAGKLGIHVVTQIERSLRNVGLRVLLPIGESDLPRDQNASVVVYLAGSRAAELIEAVHSADLGAVKTIRDISSDDSSDKLEAIRSILEGE